LPCDRERLPFAFSRAREAKPSGAANPARAQDHGHGSARRRVLALTFGPDFIHWRRSGESWPSVWPGRRLFFLIKSPAAQVRGRGAALGLATSPTGTPSTSCSLSRLFGWCARGLYPLARGCRRIWRGEFWLRRRDSARPARAAWAVQRLLAARWCGRRRRRRRFPL
jgi:hypothetical protein